MECLAGQLLHVTAKQLRDAHQRTTRSAAALGSPTSATAATLLHCNNNRYSVVGDMTPHECRMNEIKQGSHRHKLRTCPVCRFEGRGRVRSATSCFECVPGKPVGLCQRPKDGGPDQRSCFTKFHVDYEGSLANLRAQSSSRQDDDDDNNDNDVDDNNDDDNDDDGNDDDYGGGGGSSYEDDCWEDDGAGSGKGAEQAPTQHSHSHAQGNTRTHSHATPKQRSHEPCMPRQSKAA